jgi:hypothetical protein
MPHLQISQYLPAETLFDIVICDEASQSDVTVLPGMMRGKQWLIVGDRCVLQFPVAVVSLWTFLTSLLRILTCLVLDFFQRRHHNPNSKQVSPTESFVSEEEIDHLRASLPQTPQADALLPGRSLFDLCAQAFPQGRVSSTHSIFVPFFNNNAHIASFVLYFSLRSGCLERAFPLCSRDH